MSKEFGHTEEVFMPRSTAQINLPNGLKWQAIRFAFMRSLARWQNWFALLAAFGLVRVTDIYSVHANHAFTYLSLQVIAWLLAAAVLYLVCWRNFRRDMNFYLGW